MVANVRQLITAGAMEGTANLDPAIAGAMAEVPRHLFVPEPLQSRAYSDQALPIGYDSTISQPLIVAAMTDLLEVRPGDRALEVGTGSGYQAALLARLGARVHTVEIVPELAQGAAARLKALGYDQIAVRAGDGYAGWPEHAPFDRIMVTAGATHVPAPLVRQLAPNGRMVIPVGSAQDRQRLTLVTKDARGKVTTRRLARVIFIPLNERAAKRD
jgi:protein-L-isoaspartate(D-aspartate) O-methyltransferase